MQYIYFKCFIKGVVWCIGKCPWLVIGGLLISQPSHSPPMHPPHLIILILDSTNHRYTLVHIIPHSCSVFHCIVQILCGDEAVFSDMKDLCQTWYHMLVSKMLYQKPTIKSVDLHYHVQVSITLSMPESNSNFCSFPSQYCEFVNICWSLFLVDLLGQLKHKRKGHCI